MPLESLTGRAFGPHPFRICADKVAEFVLATGDDPQRWTRFAPPAFAAVALFAVAPDFLHDPEVAPYTRVLVHADQTFGWHLPWPIEELLSVRGSVDRVRTRGAGSFVLFSMVVDNAAGERVLDSGSTFLMSAESPDTAPDDEQEPPVESRARNDVASPAPLPEVGDELQTLAKSASRADLVRYAGATRDWNPIHFDHFAARASGLGGMVVHGLLMAAWATQAGTRMVDHPQPLSEARFRFRTPLRPGQQADVTGVVESDDRETVGLKVQIIADQIERVGSSMILRKA
jgi:acyl dehydratase